jgi:hypothetical protein
MAGFDTAISEQEGVLSGPFRAPKQMLAHRQPAQRVPVAGFYVTE